MGFGWCVAGLLCAITIVGLPWAKGCFVIGQFAFLPFGKEAISRSTVTGIQDVGTGPLGTIGNILWFIFAGIWLAIGHIATALACFVTIFGIPFGIQHLKLALLTLAPVGKTVVGRWPTLGVVQTGCLAVRPSLHRGSIYRQRSSYKCQRQIADIDLP